MPPTSERPPASQGPLSDTYLPATRSTFTLLIDRMAATIPCSASCIIYVELSAALIAFAHDFDIFGSAPGGWNGPWSVSRSTAASLRLQAVGLIRG